MTKAAYVNRKGEVKWSLHEIEVPTVEQCVKEDALEMQDIRELGLGWAWFMNDLRAFLPAWQEMELASPSTVGIYFSCYRRGGCGAKLEPN